MLILELVTYNTYMNFNDKKCISPLLLEANDYTSVYSLYLEQACLAA